MQKKVFDHNRIELLAPAGGMEQLVAAVENGADAVYLGGKSYNARAKAGNFTIEEIKTACGYCHIRGVKVYATLNTLVNDDENIEKIVSFAGALDECGVDALIIQDLGLGAKIRKKYPEIEQHLSTQGTVYNYSGAMAAKKLGYTRVILARECSLSQIRKITGKDHFFSQPGNISGQDSSLLRYKNNDDDSDSDNLNEKFYEADNKSIPPEIEVFVHGALCFCYSGQCQLSRNIGGRSGNKGVCAQPCRLEYTMDGSKGYHLSPKDICTLEYIPDLEEAGVKSLKIEGRLKSAEYVGTVVSIYRKYIDKWYDIKNNILPEYNNHNNGYNRQKSVGQSKKQNRELFHDLKKYYSVSDNDREKLMQVFNRGGFTEGYLVSDPEEFLMTGDVPKNQGVKIGSVVSCDRKQLVKIRLDKKYSDSTVSGKYSSEAHPLSERVPGKTDPDINHLSNEGSDDFFMKTYPLTMGDRIEIHSGKSELPGNIVTYLKKSKKNTITVGDIKGIENGIPQGAAVYRISSFLQLDEIRKTFEEGGPGGTKHRAAVPIAFRFFGYEGTHPVLKVILDKSHPVISNTCEKIEITVEDEYVIPKAIKKPTEEDIIRKQLLKLGGTPFAGDENSIDIRIDTDIMIPASVINSMRREAITQLENKIIYKWKNKNNNFKQKSRQRQNSCQGQNDRQGDTAICDIYSEIQSNSDTEYSNAERYIEPDGAIWFHSWQGYQQSKYYNRNKTEMMEYQLSCHKKQAISDAGDINTDDNDPDLDNKNIKIKHSAESKDYTDDKNRDRIKGQMQKRVLLCVPVYDWLKYCGSDQVQNIETDERSDCNSQYLLVPYLSPVTMGAEDRFIEKNFEKIVKYAKLRSKGIVIINNLGWISEFIDEGLNVIAGFGLNVNNLESALMLCNEMRVCGDFFASLEDSDTYSGMIPLMITEHQIHGRSLVDRKGKRYEIINTEISGEKGKTFILATEKGKLQSRRGWKIPCVFRR